jgi:hypothetical protein
MDDHETLLHYCKKIKWLKISKSSTLSLPEGYPVAAYVWFLVFPSPLSFYFSVRRVSESSSYALRDKPS